MLGWLMWHTLVFREQAGGVWIWFWTKNVLTYSYLKNMKIKINSKSTSFPFSKIFPYRLLLTPYNRTRLFDRCVNLPTGYVKSAKECNRYIYFKYILIDFYFYQIFLHLKCMSFSSRPKIMMTHLALSGVYKFLSSKISNRK